MANATADGRWIEDVGQIEEVVADRERDSLKGAYAFLSVETSVDVVNHSWGLLVGPGSQKNVELHANGVLQPNLRSLLRTKAVAKNPWGPNGPLEITRENVAFCGLDF